MSTRPAKRARSSTSTAAIDSPRISTPSIDLAPLIASFPTATLQGILLEAAKSNPSVAALVKTKYDHLAAAQRAKVVDFDYLSKDAWETLNVKYRSLSGSKQYDMSFDASESVVECIQEIAKECPKEASLGTKKNALETLRKIGKSICLSNDTLGHEVRKSFQYDTCLEDAMYRILETLSYGERDRHLMSAPRGEKPWYEKMCELVGLGAGHCIFAEMDNVVGLMELGKGSTDEDDEDEHGNDGEDEQSEEDEHGSDAGEDEESEDVSDVLVRGKRESLR
ncbi:MAG: hypothetical protein FRX48_01265 [Lasallia pustulata]|uniref:Uncharacterized protein n=1 Tax=Lasallia pustulata TaxID=136370 RepID=A0A5M8Q0L0_9LECA|nr:MAG: hypothetical protein FRX48_01265 [Lasallia pustulata]